MMIQRSITSWHTNALGLGRPHHHSSSVIDHREAGYQEAMHEAGLGRYIEVVRAPQNLRDIQVAAQGLLATSGKREAIFCWTDYVALEVLSVADTSGLSVPGDVAVLGHDNTMYCAFDQNSLTSIDQSGEQLGLQATRLLVETHRRPAKSGELPRSSPSCR